MGGNYCRQSNGEGEKRERIGILNSGLPNEENPGGVRGPVPFCPGFGGSRPVLKIRRAGLFYDRRPAARAGRLEDS